MKGRKEGRKEGRVKGEKKEGGRGEKAMVFAVVIENMLCAWHERDSLQANGNFRIEPLDFLCPNV